MAPVSAILHRRGFRLLRYLDDWLVLESSLKEVTRARDFLLDLCALLGIRINLEKSHLSLTQSPTYLEVRIQSDPLRAFPTVECLETFSLQLQEFMSSRRHLAHLWCSLLGRMFSLSLLVPGSRFRMRSLQLCLKRSWDFRNEDSVVDWDQSFLEDLRWWSVESNLSGVPLTSPLPDVHLYTDQGWGGTLDGAHASDLWSATERLLSINHRELLAVERSLFAFQDHLCGMRVALFADNTTAIAYLKKLGGTKSPTLNAISQSILRIGESWKVIVLSQFIASSLNVMADALSQRNQVLGSE